eukprot:jgi/Botrbrau1/16840/Bobra.150_2s0064.1
MDSWGALKYVVLSLMSCGGCLLFVAVLAPCDLDSPAGAMGFHCGCPGGPDHHRGGPGCPCHRHARFLVQGGSERREAGACGGDGCCTVGHPCVA